MQATSVTLEPTQYSSRNTCHQKTRGYTSLPESLLREKTFVSAGFQMDEFFFARMKDTSISLLKMRPASIQSTSTMKMNRNRYYSIVCFVCLTYLIPKALNSHIKMYTNTNTTCNRSPTRNLTENRSHATEASIADLSSMQIYDIKNAKDTPKIPKLHLTKPLHFCVSPTLIISNG